MRAKAERQRRIARIFEQIMRIQRVTLHFISRRDPKISRPAILQRRIILPSVKLPHDAILALLGPGPSDRAT